MSYKETCPGCDAHTSDVARAFANDQRCPSCGLSAAAAKEIMVVRQARADDAIKAEFAGLRLRADRAERDYERVNSVLSEIREVLREFDREDERIIREDW